MADTARKFHGWGFDSGAAHASGDPGSNGTGSRASELMAARDRAPALGDGRGPRNPSLAVSKSLGGYSAADSMFSSMLNLTGAEQITRPYEESKWVHACVRALATAMMHAPLRLYRGDPHTAEEDGEAVPLPRTHELQRLLEMPSLHQTGMQFREANLVHRKLDGETIWFLMDAQGEPVAASDRDGRTIPVPTTIVAVRGSAVQIKLSEYGLPEYYVYPSRTQKHFPTCSVVHFRDYDPDNPLRGLGDVEVLLRDLAVEFQAQRYQEGLLANGGDPGGWVVSKGNLSDEKKRSTEAAVNDRYGNVERAGEWHVISGKEVDIVPNNMKPKDMEYSTLREFTFRSVCAVLGVPTILLGDTASATFSNFDAAMRQLWTGPNGVISYLRSEEDVMNNFFIHRLAMPDAENTYARYDLSVVPELQEDNTEKVKEAADVAARGIGVSYQSAASQLGLDAEEIEGGELQLVDQKFSTVEEFSAPPEEEPAPPVPEEEPDDEKSLEFEVAEVLDELMTDEGLAREVYTRAVLDVVTPFERRMDSEVRKYLRKYELAQTKRIEQYAKTGKSSRAFDVADLTEKDLRALMLDPGEWTDKLYSTSAPIIDATFDAASQSIQAEIGVTGLTSEEAAVIETLEKQKVRLSNGVGGKDGTLATKVRRSIISTFEENAGLTVNSLQDAVKQLLPELKGSLKHAFVDRDSRALTIARTETGTASNTARYMNMKKSDVVEKHQWLTSGKGNVRESHAEQNGDTVEVGKKFKNGLRFPQDPRGPAEEVINCVCVAAPVIK